MVEVTEADYRSGADLRVEVINEHAVSSMGNKEVGKGKVVLKEAIPENGINWPIVVTFSLKTPTGADWGIVEMEGFLEASGMLKADTPYKPPANSPSIQVSTLWACPSRCNSLYAAIMSSVIQVPTSSLRGIAHPRMTSVKAVSTRIS
jgi:hypothetical protein